MRLTVLTFFISLLFNTSALSQDITRNGLVYYPTSSLKFMPFEHEIKKGTTSIIYAITSKNKESKFVKHMDDKGRPFSYSRLNENEDEILLFSVTYTEDDKIITETNYDKKGCLLRLRSNIWNEDGSIHEILVTDRKGLIINKTRFEYDSESGCLTAINIYIKGGKTLLETWSHTYYDECEKLKSILTGKNGKIKSEINYACKAEGEINEPQKNETLVCTWDETSPEFLMKIYQSQNSKGRLYRSVQKLNRSDSSLIEMISYNADDELTSRQTYGGSFSVPLHYISYHKGKVFYERIRTYKNQEITSQITNLKGKQRTKSIYEYDANEQLIGSTSFNKKDEIITRIRVQYFQ